MIFEIYQTDAQRAKKLKVEASASTRHIDITLPDSEFTRIAKDADKSMKRAAKTLLAPIAQDELFARSSASIQTVGIVNGTVYQFTPTGVCGVDGTVTLTFQVVTCTEGGTQRGGTLKVQMAGYIGATEVA